MKSIQASQLLKTALLADAAVSAAAAALQLAIPDGLAELLRLPRVLLVETGAFLAIYVVLLVAMARAARLWSPLVWVVVLGNVGWALGCVGLAVSPVPGALGAAFLLAQALAVLVFATLEYRGLKSSAPRYADGLTPMPTRNT